MWNASWARCWPTTRSTARSWCRCSACTWRTAATSRRPRSAAHLSRPSFYERLHRIERVLAVDLDQVESCLSLHVALLGLEALRR
ncbi:helix-turn-helix domain-containing protein [Yinghuangia aomiensis]